VRPESSIGDTIVVGAGVVGLSVAYELLRLGRTVTVLDRGPAGRGATWAAGGMLAPVAEAETEDLEVVAFGKDSLARYPEFVRGVEKTSGLSVGYRAEGTLWVAIHRDDREELDRLERLLGSKSLEVERLAPGSLVQLEPHLSGRVLGGLRLAEDHQVDPRRLARALCRAVEALGGRVLEGWRVERVEERNSRVSAVAGRRPDGTPFAGTPTEVVVAAGAWSFEGLELPLCDPGLRPVKGQLVRARGQRLISHVVRTPEVYLVPREDGELLIGATMEERGFDETPTVGAVMDLLRHAWQVVPASYDLELSEVSVGLRSAVEDHRPVIGDTAVQGLFLALGHFRNGILLAPATAHYLADRIVQGVAPSKLEPFAVDRPTVGSLPRGAALRESGS
jgi:glycine oxidase